MKTAITILILLVLNSFSDKVFACNCIGQRTVKEEIKHADAVLVGTIVSKEFITLTDSTILKMFPNNSIMRKSQMSKMIIARYNLVIQDIYKGKITNDTVTIYTGIGGGDCGIGFEIGLKYIVYGENETYFGQVNNDFIFPKAKNTFWTYNCLRTTSYFQYEINEIEKFTKKQQPKTIKKYR